MSTITAQQARNTTVFVINNYKNEIEEITLFDHIIESAEETTSPRGVEHKLYINEGEDKEGNLVWFLKEWKPGGKSHIIDKFPTEEAADEEKFQRIWKYDFMTDDQRDTMYWSTREEAEAELKERIANQ